MMNTWRYIEETAVDAAQGLATDEYLMQCVQEHGTALHLYNYRNHCALVGRFQHIAAELDTEACTRESVQFSRRLTGGGAILMGEDQLGVCLAARTADFEWSNIRDLCEQFAQPLIKALAELGIQAQFRSKNDLEVGGKKIAGLGVYVSPEGAMHFHASLLNDLDIALMLRVLQIPIQKYDDRRKMESVAQRMTTITRETDRKIPLAELRQLIRNAFEAHFGIHTQEIPLDDNDRAAINTLALERYSNPDWIFQRSPQADMSGMSLKKTPAGLLRTYIGLKGENIKSVLVTGDFFEHEQLFTTVESRLKWSPLDRDNIQKTVAAVFEKTPQKPSNLSENDLTEAIWLAAQRALAANRYTYKGACYYPEV